jgi:hypothetical protein
MSTAPEAGPALTGEEEKKIRTWRRAVLTFMWTAGAALLLEGVLLLWPGVPRATKLAVVGIFVELAISTAVLGAFGRCPRCNSSFEAPPGELLPDHCRQCGVVLQTWRNR